ncbi:hypothetical protein FHS43_004487 [Streptosporangium becharense]|uniref:Nitroimidazol reductase NimA-like FMN-containing flavoprotein (Pyridoxamine 5'-phosphate oxidase superfamily) n=1 Tax=Streptosporangium becharense TaxID=1816182 RepID=A0A7W9IK48_9ACTN|nr:pyridoxamine 5'-phosphate oxidase family protein [Streptosporangium becharense]MBB2913189.1 hypothetical protein [Streptosporangium becharense]MBB5822172.1 nitroimidazol reductase NimA-like FMN-containing flavoprotein (pyridoxamine 5'-phosphate oxidase superfamily) [Streptosporangium becharense]
MTDLSSTERTRHRRFSEKGRTDRAALHEVLRAGFVCHLGVVVDGVPMVVPTVYGFDVDHLYVHGSVASRSMTGGGPTGRRPTAEMGTVCVTVTHVDGLVLARSVFEHGVNYRSAMIYSEPRRLEGEEKLEGLRILTEQAAPGQWDYARRPSRKELAATTVLAIPLAEASVKVSSGPPDDGDGPDAELGLWAGVLPLATTWLPPVPDPLLPEGTALPGHIAGRAGTPLT